MKRLVYFFVTIALFLSGCGSTIETLTPTNTLIPIEISTSTSSPTATKASTETPIAPTPTFTPLDVAPVGASPLTLTEFNAGTEMKRLNVIGTGAAHDIEFSPDGARFAVATGRGVYLYDGMTFEQNGFIDVNDSVSAIAFSPNGNVLAVAVDGKASLWNVSSGQQMMSLEGGMISIYKLVYGLNGQVAALGGECRGCGTPVLGMILWDGKTGDQIYVEHDIWYSTLALAFTPDGNRLFFGGREGVEVLDSETGRQVATYATQRPSRPTAIDTPESFIFDQAVTQLFVKSFGEASMVYELQSQTQKPFQLCGNYAYFWGNAMNGMCSNGNEINLFDLATEEIIKSFDVGMNLESWGSVLALSPDSQYLVFGDKGNISVLNTESEQVVKRLSFTSFDAMIAGIVLVDGNEKYVAAVENPPGQISLIDIQSGENILTLALDCCALVGFAFAPDHKTFATISGNILNLWDLSTQKIIYQEKFEKDYSDAITFSPDGSKIYLTNYENYDMEFDLETRALKSLARHSYKYDFFDPFAVDNFHFNQFGNFVTLEFEINYDGSNPIYRDLVTDQTITIPYKAIADSQFPETFALDGSDQHLVFGNAGGIYVWDLTTLEQIWHLDKHEWRGGDGWIGAIKSLMFNPQSNLLVSVGWDGTTRLWSITTGNEIRRLNVCCSAGFTPDGQYLATAGDGVIRVWGISK